MRAMTAMLTLLAALLVGCRGEEQGRPLTFDKGHYAGKPVTLPSATALAALKDRAERQRY